MEYGVYGRRGGAGSLLTDPVLGRVLDAIGRSLASRLHSLRGLPAGTA
jgi:hypothetical protein